MKKPGPEEDTISVEKDVANCPVCGEESRRHSRGIRRVRDLTGVVWVRYSKHYCPTCDLAGRRKYFSVGAPGFVGKQAAYSIAFKRAAVGMVHQGKTLEKVCDAMRIPLTTLHDWVLDDALRAG